MAKLDRFLKTAGVFFVGNVFTKLFAFLLLPLYTTKINPNEFGTYGFVLSLTNLFIPIIFLQVWDAIFRFSFDENDNDGKYKVITNGLIVMFIGTFVYLAGFGIVTFFIDIEHSFFIMLYGLGIGIQYFYTVVARSFKNNGLFVISGLVNTFIMLLFNLIFIMVFNMGVEVLYISSFIGTFIQILIIESQYKVVKHIVWRNINVKALIMMLKFSIPLSFATISHWLLTGFTQFYISYELGMSKNGVFTVANKFSSMIVLIIGMFQFAWNELAYTLSNESNKNLYYNKGVTEILKITIIGSSVFILVVKLIFPFIIGIEYQEAYLIIPLLIVGTSANSYAGFLGTIFLSNKKSNKLFITTLLSSVFNVIGIIILTPLFGLFGATLSLCIAFIVNMIVRTIMLKRSENVGPDISSYSPLILLFTSIIVYYYTKNDVVVIVAIISILILGAVAVKDLLKVMLTIIKREVYKSIHKFPL